MLRARAPRQADADALTRIWHEGWHDAHAHIVPAALTRLRTFGSFRDRLVADLNTVRVLETTMPVGFTMIRGAELYQFYVARSARGSGAAAVLMADAEAGLMARGVDVAWLACAIGNDRAARFYEKCGWTRADTMVVDTDTDEGSFFLRVWRYEKRLAGA